MLKTIIHLKEFGASTEASDRERVEFLFALYEKLTAPLTATLDKPKRGRKK